jgi:hypothetical protein
MIKAGAEEMQRRFGLSVALVIIDTAGKAAGYSKAGEENDSAIAKIIMRTLSTVALQTNTLVTAVAHFGKHIETGTRGSSAYEDDADVVLAALTDKNMAGAVTNTRLTARKRRSGPSGEEYPFRTKANDRGIDPTGIPLNTLTIEWIDAAATSQPPQGKPDAWRKKSLRLLRQTLMNVLGDHSKDMKPWAEGPTVRAVDLEIVRGQFYRAHPAAEGTDPKSKADARRQAFKRAINDARAANLISSWEIGSVTYVWLVAPHQTQETPVHSGKRVSEAPPPSNREEMDNPKYEVLGPAPTGEQCTICGKGCDVQRVKHRGRVNLWHLACVDRHLAAKANPPVKPPDRGPDPPDEHGAPRQPE